MKGDGSEFPDNCLNCNTPLQGQWCHHCGQKARSQVRHFGSVFTDIMDTVFEYDNRIWRTLLPLYFRPGSITRHYIAGRRASYVLPFRLFFVLSVVSFLMLQLFAVPERLVRVEMPADTAQFSQLDSIDEVINERDRQLQQIGEAIADIRDTGLTADDGLAIRTLESAADALREAADRRVAELGGNAGGAEVLTPSPPVEDENGLENGGIIIDGEPVWHPTDHPLQLDWLPGQANRLLNDWMARAVGNLERVGEDPRQLIESMLGLLPVVLFFMLPFFALLLKVFYLFTGRLYMEHFVVALHSHSFLFLAMLVSLLLDRAAEWAASVDWLHGALDALRRVSLLWIPVYLLLMQRAVYQQNWVMTVGKYGLVGTLYIVLVTIALLAAALISLVSL